MRALVRKAADMTVESQGAQRQSALLDADALLLRDDERIIDEASLLIFRIWMQLGGLTSPPTPQEIADMDAPLAMDMASLLRQYRRAQEAETELFEMFGSKQKRTLPDPFDGSGTFD